MQVIYEATFSIEKSHAGEFAKWLPERVKQVLMVPGFRQAKLFRLDSAILGESRVGWTVQFEVSSKRALEAYLKGEDVKLRPEPSDLFGEALAVTTNTHHSVEVIFPPVSEGGGLMPDFPKVYCPFIRQTFEVNRDQWKKVGRKYQLRQPEVYLAIDRVNPGYEWVFEDANTFAVEKLHGTNIKILMEGGRVKAIQNRKNVVDPLAFAIGQVFILEGLLNSASKEQLPFDGEHAGELIGPKLQGNPYKLEHHEWFAFERSITELRYKSLDDHARTYQNWSSWFKDYLHSRLFTKRASKRGSDEKVFAEGVIFYNLQRRAERKTWMAKLRRDMFPWYYPELDLHDFNPVGRPDLEDQEGFD